MSDKLLEKIKCRLSESMPRIMQDIEEYGKAEFERGYAKGIQVMQELMWHERRDMEGEIKERIESLEYDLGQAEGRKDDAVKYWQVARETLQTHIDKALELTKQVIELKEQNKELMRENVGLRKALDLELISFDGKLEEKEPEWYDAEKCWPKQGRKIIGELESQCASKAKVQHEGKLVIIDGVPILCYNGITVESGFGPKFTGPYKTLKWRYADE
jgi:hypothetical protein